MKLHSTWLVGLALAGLLAGCSTPASRESERAAALQSATPAQRRAIAEGRVELGFTPDMVYIVLGKPEKIERGETPNVETWIYYQSDAAAGWNGGMPDVHAHRYSSHIIFTHGKVTDILLG
ncbi:hypothetical protein K0B96_08755 [Horticoccus luteus]|uniref:Lipoprotein SmpA/OmlA domain-containing protein n=1 Tax=Horticoccus luteus TaxID=2862869 RepID=A0A8F9TZL7_9BACT|nr:hypothetical protein [Horticoccus luteus]QYM80673.1 hypothetical protein K0B96_08755 [Horticoccus luteus]